MALDRIADYRLPSHFQPGRVLDLLAPDCEPQFHDRTLLKYQFLDSFDWRLFRGGVELFAEREGEALALICRTRVGERLAEDSIATAPRTGAELPTSRGYRTVVDLLDGRALLPQIEMEGVRRRYVVHDSAGVVAAVFDFEELSLDTASAKSGLAPRLCIRAEKRARKLFSQLAERLNVDLELTEARESALEEALALRGVSPRDPSALIREPLDPLGRADAAAKRVFGQLLGTLRCNEAGVIGEIDTEFLHDFRVAIRRTRAALRQLKSVFPDRQTERFVAFFAELGAMTSEPRDLDVFLLEFDGTAAELAEPLRRHLEPLRVLIQQRAEHAHRKLNRYLMSRNYRNGMASWQRFLAGPPPVRASARNARLAIKPLTDQRIWKLYRKLIRGGRAIGGGGDPAELHELRKTAKKLRYVMELFRSLYPSERVGPMLKALKDLQDYLGTYQDTEVKIAALTRFADELHGRGVPAPVLISVGALIDRAYVAERELRKDFHKRFSEFADAAEARKLKRMVKLPGIGAGDLEAQAA